MAARKKKVVENTPVADAIEEIPAVTEEIQEEIPAVIEEPVQEEAPEEIEKEEIVTPAKKKAKKETKKVIEEVKIGPKYPVGSIVYVAKDADADLNGFKLFPQYKKYTYTVEAYDEFSEVYYLRRLNLLLKLKEDLIINPDEHAHDSLNRKQF